MGKKAKKRRKNIRFTYRELFSGQTKEKISDEKNKHFAIKLIKTSANCRKKGKTRTQCVTQFGEQVRIFGRQTTTTTNKIAKQ